MTSHDATVFIVDDDDSVRKATARLFRTAGYNVIAFETASEFLNQRRPVQAGCLILDLEMPGLSGIELQQQLKAHHVDLPIVFMTGHGDIPTTVQAMKDGAVDFLPKPVDDERLLATVREAVRQHVATLHSTTQVNTFLRRTESLTKREHEVMLLVITGMLNKQVAKQLGITETTVKVHRGRVMQKTGVNSIAELVLMCSRAGLGTNGN